MMDHGYFVTADCCERWEQEGLSAGDWRAASRTILGLSALSLINNALHSAEPCNLNEKLCTGKCIEGLFDVDSAETWVTCSYFQINLEEYHLTLCPRNM
jgi:hypothetical protein